jgi:FAD:protein FMN transferase
MQDCLRHEFRAMGTHVALIGPPPGGPADRYEFGLTVCAVEVLFSELDERFSRFLGGSEVSGVNARAGRWTRVSRPFADLLELSLSFARETAGLFDPTLLEALVAAGYDRDWAEIQTSGALVRPPLPLPPPPSGSWREVEFRGTMVRLSKGAGLDFGGVAKGWAVDRATEAAAVLPWAVVNAGGDLRLGGCPPTGGLQIGVEDPADPSRHILKLQLEEGALATSSVLSRTWGPGLHELIDPRTSRPAETGVVQATVWAPTCAEAEIRAKWAMLTGPVILERIPGIMVMDDGRIMLNLESSEGVGRVESVQVRA